MTIRWIKLLAAAIPFFALIGYVALKYTYIPADIESISISTSSNYNSQDVILYTTKSNEIDINYEKVYKAKTITDSTIVFNIDGNLTPRIIRIYFQAPIKELDIYSVKFIQKNNIYTLNKAKFATGNSLNVVRTISSKYTITSLKNNGYIEYKTFIYGSDKLSIIIGFTIALLLSLLIYYFFSKVPFEYIYALDLGKISVIIFILSIFLPLPIFNITLVIALLLNLKNFKFRTYYSGWPSIIFVLFFCAIFINDIFIGEEGIHNLSSTGKALPFIALPILFASINSHNYLKYFLVMAITMCVWLILTSIIDVLIYRNIEILSFNQFTKHIHPVYFSYLLASAIFYTQLHIKKDYKYLVVVFLSICLILSGSKLITTITIILFLLLVSSYKIKFILLGFLVTVFLLFEPIQERFEKIIDLTDLSILDEKYIEDPRDHRINGLTFRLLLWQETLKINKKTKEVLLGMGVGNESKKELSKNLIKRGLIEHSSYKAHNQYITTYWRMGLVGLTILISLLVVLIILSIKTKNKLLLIVTIILAFAMITETVFGRVNGIYFFTTLILTLSDKRFFSQE